MHPELTHVRGIEELDKLLTESETRPLLLFKHSYTCGISAEAFDELIAHLNGGGPRSGDVGISNDVRAKYAVVTVQTHRDVSNAVTMRLGVRHETPQALVIRERQVIWSASHFRVTADAMHAAIRAAAQ